jgi:hypothetical protein
MNKSNTIKMTITLSASLLYLLMAGCSSVPVAKGSSNTQLKPSGPVEYHNEVVSDYSEGEATFLRLVSESNPKEIMNLREIDN